MACKECGKEIETGKSGDFFVSISVTHHRNPHIEDGEASHAFALCGDCYNDDSAGWINQI